MMATLMHVLRPRGIAAEGYTTSPLFQGSAPPPSEGSAKHMEFRSEPTTTEGAQTASPTP